MIIKRVVFGEKGSEVHIGAVLNEGIGVTMDVYRAVMTVVDAQLVTRRKQSEVLTILQIHTCSTGSYVIYTVRNIFEASRTNSCIAT